MRKTGDGSILSTERGTVWGSIRKITGRGAITLGLVLGGASEASAQTNDSQEIRITENITISNDENQENVIDLCNTMNNTESQNTEAEIDSIMKKYKNEFFEYRNGLPESEKQDYIFRVVRENKVIEKIIIDMLEDEDIIKAIKLGDKNAIIAEFLVDILFNKISNTLSGRVIASIVLLIIRKKN